MELIEIRITMIIRAQIKQTNKQAHGNSWRSARKNRWIQWRDQLKFKQL